MARSRAFQLSVVVGTVFLDFIGISLVIPVAAPYFLSATDGLFGASVSLDYRTLILGLLLGTAPFMQFFSAPLLGAYADRAGRKPVLLVSVLATGLGHFLFGVGMLTQQLWLLFASRVLTGAGAGNLAAANSVVADVSGPDDKVRNFGLIGMAIGLGFILGPFFGGKLSDPALAEWFNLATPLWIATALSVINALFILVFFQETLRDKLRRSMSMMTGIRNIVKAFAIPNLRVLYAVNLLLGFGFQFFAQFFSVFLISRFHFGSSEIGILFAYVGICIALTQGVATRALSRVANPITVLRWAPLLGATTLLFLSRVEHVQTIYLLLPLVALGYGVNPPNLSALISNLADKESQGEALGINQSMQALSFGIPPIVSGFIAAIDVTLPLLMAACLVMAAWVLFIVAFRPLTHTKTFHEV